LGLIEDWLHNYHDSLSHQRAMQIFFHLACGNQFIASCPITTITQLLEGALLGFRRIMFEQVRFCADERLSSPFFVEKGQLGRLASICICAHSISDLGMGGIAGWS
jgi:hypothetical protein